MMSSRTKVLASALQQLNRLWGNSSHACSLSARYAGSMRAE